MAAFKPAQCVTACCHRGVRFPLSHDPQDRSNGLQRTTVVRLSRRGRAGGIVVAGQEDEDASSAPSSSSGSRLGSIIRTKQRILQSQLGAMAAGQLEERLASVRPAPSVHQVLERIADRIFQGKTTVVAEVARLSPAESPDSLAQRCSKYVEWGADVLAVRTDEERSPDGMADLRAVCQAVQVPVLRKDWIIHPLQIVDTREAGAAGLTVVCSVLSKGTAAILNYTTSLGLDAIVEVVNMKELQDVIPLGIPLYGFNISVGLALPLPGLRESIAKSLIGEVPFGATSVAGVRSLEDAVQMRLAGADAVYLSLELVQGNRAADYQDENTRKLLSDFRDAMTGDD